MYKVTYLPDPLVSQVIAFEEFDSYKSVMYFANKFQVDGIVLEIKYYPKENKKSDRN